MIIKTVGNGVIFPSAFDNHSHLSPDSETRTRPISIVSHTHTHPENKEKKRDHVIVAQIKYEIVQKAKYASKETCIIAISYNVCSECQVSNIRDIPSLGQESRTNFLEETS